MPLDEWKRGEDRSSTWLKILHTVNNRSLHHQHLCFFLKVIPHVHLKVALVGKRGDRV